MYKNVMLKFLKSLIPKKKREDINITVSINGEKVSDLNAEELSELFKELISQIKKERS